MSSRHFIVSDLIFRSLIYFELIIIWASLIAQLVKNPPVVQGTLVGKIPWRRVRLPTSVFLDFPCGSAGKESACDAEALGSIPGLGRSSEEGKGYPPQYSGLENPMDSTVHGVAKSQTQLSDFHFPTMQHWRSFPPCVELKLFPLDVNVHCPP